MGGWGGATLIKQILDAMGPPPPTSFKKKKGKTLMPATLGFRVWGWWGGWVGGTTGGTGRVPGAALAHNAAPVVSRASTISTYS